MLIECWFDGACEPVNPNGHASYGALVRSGMRTLFSESGYVGFGEGMSNNVAEYAGIIAVMKFLVGANVRQAIIFGDSKLVVKQMNGKWRAKGGAYIPFYKEAIKLRAQLPDVVIQWIPRERNGEADYLSRQALHSVPRSATRQKELRKLVNEQVRDKYDPRYKVVASRTVKGCPF
jgi:ribonuclease HI